MKVVHFNKEKSDYAKAVTALAKHLTQKWNRQNKEKEEHKKAQRELGQN